MTNEEMASALEGQRVLVTGGLGFIGSQVARRLVALGAEVSLIDALLPDCGGNLFNVSDVQHRVRVRVADLRDLAALADLLPDCRFVFNLAGQVSHVDSMTHPQDDLESYARAQLCLLEACRRLNPEARVVLASTRQVYGRPRYLPVDEEHPCDPCDVNGIHKWAAEQYHRVYRSAYGIQIVVLRLSNTYGPGQLVKHARQGFMGWFVRLAAEGREIEVMGDGEQLRDLNHVDDVVEALLLAAVSPLAEGRTYNLGGAPPVPLKEIARLLVEVAGRGSWRLIPFPADRGRIDVGSTYTDATAIRKDLGWVPKVGLREGLEATVRFYERHLERYV